jgi:hypothetical protein
VVVARRPGSHARFQPSGPARACPVCKRNDRAEKASAVVAQNSGTVWGDNGHAFRYRNELAMLLSAPPRPEAPGWPKAAKAFGASLALAGILLAGYQLLRSATSIPYPAELAIIAAIGLFGVVLPLRVLVGTYLQRRQMSQRLPAWTEAANRWHRVYYCFRDDVVFLEGQVTYFAPRDLEKLLLTERPVATQKLVLRQAPLEG